MNRTPAPRRVGELSVTVRVVPTRATALLPGPSYLGACDASAAVDLDGSRFVIASDEPTASGKSSLHVYELDLPRPVASLRLRDDLGLDGLSEGEIDLEAAARVDKRIYWASSHGRKADGDPAESRRRFFATEVDARGRLKAVGRSYARLVEDMLAEPALAPLGLARVEERGLAPKHGGLNIEGMAARPDGALLLGLRSPLLEGCAALVPFLNPDAVLDGRERARFAAPIRLDFGGNGVRDLTHDPARHAWIVLAGAAGRGNGRALYAWSGEPGERAVPIDASIPRDFNAEAVLVDPATGRLRLFSDDGERVIDPGRGKPRRNKDLKDSRRTFRSLWLLVK